MDQQHSLAHVGNHINSFYQKKTSTSIIVVPTQFGNYNQIFYQNLLKYLLILWNRNSFSLSLL